MLVKPLVRPIVRAIAGNPTASLGSGFSPTSLFLDGSKGVVYDNNDLSSFYLDSAGVTPATVNGLVGLQLDKSGNLALGSEVMANSSFDSGATGWLTTAAGYSFSGGQAILTAVADNQSLYQTGVVVVDRWYRIVVDVASITGGAVYPAVGGTGSGTTINTAGVYEFTMRAPANTNANLLTSGVTSCVINSFSVKQISGNHRYQTTTGSKPVLRGTPTGANLVTNGDFATDTVWTKGTGWTIGSGVATKAAGSTGGITQAYALVSGNVYRVTYTITASAGSIQPYFPGGSTAFGTLRATSGTYVEYITAGAGNTSFGFFANALFAGTLDNVEIVDVSAGQVTAPYGLQYDGVDDFLQTAAVDFTATDKMFVCAGVRKLSDSAQGIVAELTASLAANNGSFYLSAPNSAAANYAFASKGTVSATDIEAGFTAPHLAVLSGIGNISGDSAQLRTNGVAGTAVTTDQGTGNYANAVLYFGRRGGSSLPYNGLDFGYVICGKTLTSNQISQTERYIAQRTGVTI